MEENGLGNRGCLGDRKLSFPRRSFPEREPGKVSCLMLAHLSHGYVLIPSSFLHQAASITMNEPYLTLGTDSWSPRAQGSLKSNIGALFADKSVFTNFPVHLCAFPCSLTQLYAGFQQG